ncbi:GNAT family N-acetyltransferase [Patescibacteria group bacterium]|nr:GNAT family N-acetyltransferase [Patescibacteria group bacterium]MBU1722101.1 GNAT family N-acetyltransferase [Patescibacteria group bacterium]MBU1901591.1 GNAT family N-acetyltransferase [Patescibacteria group bacterium]
MEYLQTDRIIFQPYTDEHNITLYKWFNDPEVTQYMFTGQKPITLQQVNNQVKEDLDGENVIMLVFDKKDNKLIGIVGLYNIHQTARKAEMRIIIGEKEYWGKGYGTEITELITFYGFDRLNLHRIYLGYTSANASAAKAYAKAGYVQEGILKEDIYRNSQYYDSIRMAILRDDYYERFYQEHQKMFVKI